MILWPQIFLYMLKSSKGDAISATVFTRNHAPVLLTISTDMDASEPWLPVHRHILRRLK